MTFSQRAQLGHRAPVGRLEVVCVLRLARELGAQHGPTGRLRFATREVGLLGRVRVERGLQAQNLGAVRGGRIVRRVQLSGERVDLALPRGKLGRLGGELLGRGV